MGDDALLVNNYKIPAWASKPPPGIHLDVMKDGKLVQKLMMDEKLCYFFGRNRQLCDFPIDHQSGSRVHAALIWHKHLNRAFLVDLNSVHGTFIGRIKLEGNRPQQVPIDSEIHFGASKRMYVIRERPALLYTTNSSTAEADRVIKQAAEATGNANQLPHTEIELDNLTQFNTAHNRRITSVIGDMPPPISQNRKNSLNGSSYRHSVHFHDTDVVINPEDIDPSVGRFRNLVQETFIPNKGKGRHDGADLGIAAPNSNNHSSIESTHQNSDSHLIPPAARPNNPSISLAVKLGLPMPNLAPDVDSEAPMVQPRALPRLSAEDILGGPLTGMDMPKLGGKRSTASKDVDDHASSEPKKKKYAKEAWPGKRPGFIVGPSAV